MKHSIFFILLFYSSFSYTQNNLVPNYSFEDSVVCPTPLNDRLPKPWYLTCSKVGVFAHSCSLDSIVSVPYNYIGTKCYQYPRTGNGYIFLSHYDVGGNFRTYVQVKLKDSLKPTKKYYCEFYVNISNNSTFACNNSGMLFSKTAVFVDTTSNLNFNVNYAIPQVLNFDNPIIGDTLNWSKVSAIITAQGGEKYITLGNFSDDAHTNKKIINSTVNSSTGYYLDDISVIPLDSYNLNADAGKDTTITIGDSVFIGTYTNGIDTLKWQRLNTNNTIDSTHPGFWVHPTAYTCYVLTQTVNGYTSSDTVCITVNPLPLKFINYQVSTNNNQIINHWQTANEINVSHFNIQRSINGKDFTNIAQQKAQNKNYNEYNFTDPLTTNNLPLTIYYRIAAIDNDGKTNYTETKKIQINQLTNQPINIYPNPAKDYINISSKETIKEIKIINQLSQVLQHQTPNTKQLIINTNQFSKGIYIVQITTTNGEVKTQKIIIE